MPQLNIQKFCAKEQLDCLNYEFAKSVLVFTILHNIGKMILGIDTAKPKETRVYLKNQKGEIVKILTEIRKPGSQVLLPQILKILKSKNLGFDNLTGVEVKTGPGSFTGLRVGVAVANALGFSLGIPVNGRRPDKGRIVVPRYDS